MHDIASHIRNVPDWPKPGIQFKDITPLFADPAALEKTIDAMALPFRDQHVDLVLGTEARGFLFAPALALALKAGVALARKPGKLPWKTHKEAYALEYGTDTIEIHQDSIAPGQRVLLVDDLLATGGTILAASNLVKKAGGIIVGYGFLIELAFLNGRQKLDDTLIHSLIRYDTPE